MHVQHIAPYIDPVAENRKAEKLRKWLNSTVHIAKKNDKIVGKYRPRLWEATYEERPELRVCVTCSQIIPEDDPAVEVGDEEFECSHHSEHGFYNFNIDKENS